MEHIKKKYILDLGMHIGDDTAYYLYRGFDVVAVEANPDLVSLASKRFKESIDEGRLTILGYALTSLKEDRVEFYLAETNTEWSSLEKWRVEQTGGAKAISVPSITLPSILQAYGTPHYIKCDLEGADEDFVEQLSQVPNDGRPEFVSVEAISTRCLEVLASTGYDRVQLVSQARIRRAFDPEFRFVTDQGEERSWTFSPHSSGRFGYDLDHSKWISVSEAVRRWRMFQELRELDPDMALDNWFDFHVTTAKTLQA